VSDQGKEIISDIEPYYRADLLGWYHPYNPWRYVGQVGTDGSGNFLSSALTAQPGTSFTPNTPKDLPGDPKTLAKSTIPPGYVACDGTSYAAAAFPLLFAQIGYTWGGSGANFNVPDWRGRTLIGDGTGAGLSARTLGTQNIGEETHTLSTTEIPSHTHDLSNHTHSYFQSTGTNTNGISGGGSTMPNTSGTGSTGGPSNNNSGAQGGGGAHNNMQPSAVVKWIIKI
jgi:microcystin-dependent protein